MTGKKVSSYPKPADRTKEDAEDWFQTHVPAKLEVLSYKGEMKNNHKDATAIKVAFEVERMAVKPDASGRTKYHIGNRDKGLVMVDISNHASPKELVVIEDPGKN